jgi:sulfur-oxidizing protein SoxY
MRKGAPHTPELTVAGPAATAFKSRRKLLAAGAGLGAAALLRPVAWAQTAIGAPDGLAAAISGFTGGKPVLPGKVTLDISPIVDNGNSVPVTVTVNSPMTATDHVSAIAIFNERNPQRDVANFRLGARAGRANVSTRIRLATSQQLVAVAQLSDGTYWSHSVDVFVALAACIE